MRQTDVVQIGKSEPLIESKQLMEVGRPITPVSKNKQRCHD